MLFRSVGRDKQETAADRQSTFGSALTREQIDALSDDSDVLQQQLNDLAGPGAVIRVDSFEGSPLPPKSQIKSIHITRDGFAAENHNAGAFYVDIVTQPGIGPIRGQTFYHIRDGSMTGKSPFVTTKGPERLQEAGFTIGGSLADQKASFSLRFNGYSSFETPNLNAALPTGTVSQALSIRTPTKSGYVNGLFDYALTKDQTLRLSFTEQDNGTDNQGIGAYDLPERAFSNVGRQCGRWLCGAVARRHVAPAALRRGLRDWTRHREPPHSTVVRRCSNPYGPREAMREGWPARAGRSPPHRSRSVVLLMISVVSSMAIVYHGLHLGHSAANIPKDWNLMMSRALVLVS